LRGVSKDRRGCELSTAPAAILRGSPLCGERLRMTAEIVERVRRLPHHRLQLRERRVGGAGAGFAGVLDNAVEPCIDKENRALA
jgi:hypothetical protein